jgi:predicted transcriptional regulator
MYFNSLLDRGFVGSTDDPEKGKCYYLTEKGIDLMNRLRKVEEIYK